MTGWGVCFITVLLQYFYWFNSANLLYEISLQSSRCILQCERWYFRGQWLRHFRRWHWHYRELVRVENDIQERDRLTLPSRWWPRYLRFRSKKPLTNVHEVKNKRRKTNKKKTRCKKRYVLNSLRVAAPYPRQRKNGQKEFPSPFILSQTLQKSVWPEITFPSIFHMTIPEQKLIVYNRLQDAQTRPTLI